VKTCGLANNGKLKKAIQRIALVLPFGLAIKHGHFGIRRDVKLVGRRLKLNRLVEPSFERSHRPVHDDNCRTVVNPQDAAETFIEFENISGAQLEWIGRHIPDDAELNLIRVSRPLLGWRFSRTHVTASNTGSRWPPNTN